MALDTSNFTADKEGGKGYQAYRKACQAAYKDLNLVLDLKPKLNIMDGTAVMGAKIMEKVGAYVGMDPEGNPIWTKPELIAKLNPETLELYTYLVGTLGSNKDMATEPEPTTMEPTDPGIEGKVTAPVTDPEIKYVANGSECPGWALKKGPSKKYEATCDACGRKVECVEQAEPAAKPPGKAKKTPEEKEAEKQAKAAEKAAAKEARKQERAAAKEPKEKRYTRADAFAEAVRKGGTMQEILSAQDEAYERNTGKKPSATAQSEQWVFGNYMAPLLALGFIEKDLKGRYSLKG